MTTGELSFFSYSFGKSIRTANSRGNSIANNSAIVTAFVCVFIPNGTPKENGLFFSTYFLSVKN